MMNAVTDRRRGGEGGGGKWLPCQFIDDSDLRCASCVVLLVFTGVSESVSE